MFPPRNTKDYRYNYKCPVQCDLGCSSLKEEFMLRDYLKVTTKGACFPNKHEGSWRYFKASILERLDMAWRQFHSL